MPELPEVEVVRRGLVDHVAGRVVASAEVLHPRSTRRHSAGPTDFSDRLAGRRLAVPARRGKYLWVPLEDGAEALLVHLGMSGQLLVQPPGAPDEKHLRVRLRFADDGPEVRFVDQRTFGGLALVPTGADGLPEPVAHIARDPLDPAFDELDTVRRLRARRTGLKRALLDQTLVSGIGNIYADEALWRARLHYARPTEKLTRGQALTVLGEARQVMAEALGQGGTSFDALYVNVNGQSGYFDRSLHAYGQAGRPCDRCGTPIRRAAFMNRSSFWCPVCQPAPRRPAA
ncbi:formamidopyrimidine-DNA glycosylase [Motilibacter peucedani]|uniref:Formamidopyrimidine-DNA glycosylase n=1 Tax=Motilibacter peucedani TaxID=598650 RepID=A0A420XR07_9ACTN|nr:bifunctional DNA-formamidopyrimidine glycosylase/DNA-(apurinic or apyrimidinic site) lyase [Motilibacter peucedani]RKS77336.1 formamidopyrimidine-DNA glycosylase [Motilibacter peucedani]